MIQERGSSTKISHLKESLSWVYDNLASVNEELINIAGCNLIDDSDGFEEIQYDVDTCSINVEAYIDS